MWTEGLAGEGGGRRWRQVAIVTGNRLGVNESRCGIDRE